jgi:tyrosine-specific transport protein
VSLPLVNLQGLQLNLKKYMSKVIGGTLLVAGTSIGAAMIAMPVTAAKVGLISSIILLFLVASVMYYLAQVNIEIFNLCKVENSISKVAGNVIGRKSQIITSFSILALLISLLVAYISGLGEIISNFTNYSYRTVVISLVLILFLSLGFSQKIFDYYNRIAFIFKLLVMATIALVLGPNVSVSNLVDSSIVTIEDLSFLTIMPVFVTSFGFHGSIPFIYKYLGRDERLYRRSTIYGIVITLCVYILWLTLSFGNIRYEELGISTGSLSHFISLFDIDSKILKESINLFALLAIVTSLFGVAVGLYDFLEEFIVEKFNFKNRFPISALTFFLPGIFCIFGKSLFISALGLAGCALTIIAIIIPILIRFKLGSVSNKNLLYISFIVGILTILGELLSL